MKTELTQNISSLKAIDIIKSGFPLVNVHIKEKLRFTSGSEYNKPLILENCIIEDFEAIMVQFLSKLKFTQCHFKSCKLMFSYFYKGLIIENCTFEQDLDLSSGGHNEMEHPIIITNNSFSGFVNFADCWFTGPITVTTNSFQNGTNIDAKNQFLTFDFPPIIEKNSGKTDDVEPSV